PIGGSDARSKSTIAAGPALSPATAKVADPFYSGAADVIVPAPVGAMVRGGGVAAFRVPQALPGRGQSQGLGSGSAQFPAFILEIFDSLKLGIALFLGFTDAF